MKVKVEGKVLVYPFNERGIVDLESDCVENRLVRQFNSGAVDTCSKDFEYLFSYLARPNMQYGIYKIMGVIYDFKPCLKRFLVHDKYYGWQEYWSLSKTAIRKAYVTPSHILEIVQV